MSTEESHNDHSYFDHPPKPALVAEASPIGNTAGGLLAYGSFVYADKALGAATLAPPSPPNVASFSVVGELRNGQPFIRGINASVRYFDLKSTFYSCQSLNGQGSASIPVTCTTQVAGVQTSGKTVIKELQFNPPLLPVGVKFASTGFPDEFKGLKNVTIQAVQSLLPQQLTVISFDNVGYTAYTC
ncbi:MAG: hypothetical protein Q9219_006361 [cf. Caloplaca sp. 3 TL-2023]